MRPSLLSKNYLNLSTIEVEQFGIKIVLIEPDVVKSLFFDNLKMATNAQGSDSPYLDDAKNKCRIRFFIRKCYFS
jgi:hypothetical protein